MSLVRESVPLAPPWLPLWGSCHEVTERVKNALSAPLGHLSHRERQVALIRHGYAVPPSPKGRLLGCGLPHQCEHWFAMTYGFRFYSIKIERYRAVPNGVTTTDQLAHALPAGAPGHPLSETTRRRYRAVPNSLTSSDQLTHALSAATRRPLIIYLRFLPISLLLFWAKWGILY